jgi:hypothetical protein
MPYSNFNLKRVKNELNVNMTAWQFLRLKENDVEVDLKEYL